MPPEIAELISTLRTVHRIENPRAVDRICREAADVIEELATAPAPKRRGRPPKHEAVSG